MYDVDIKDDTVYTQTARFDGTARALTEEELRNLAPSIFARSGHSGLTSERFAHVDTIDVLKELEKEGFSVVGAKQSISRDEHRHQHMKHLLRLRRLNDNRRVAVGTVTHELLFKNGSDGSTPCEVLSGLFRVQCENSLVARTQTLDSIKVFHKAHNAMEKVIEGVATIIKTSDEILSIPEKWGKLNLTNDQKKLLSVKAHELRFGSGKSLMTPEMLLAPVRDDDRADDLFTVFNVMQERCMKGKQHLAGVGPAARRSFVTRGIKSVDREVKLNQDLWNLANCCYEVLK